MIKLFLKKTKKKKGLGCQEDLKNNKIKLKINRYAKKEN